MSAVESNPKPDKLFKKRSIILVLSEINNFLNKLNLQVTRLESLGVTPDISGIKCY